MSDPPKTVLEFLWRLVEGVAVALTAGWDAVRNNPIGAVAVVRAVLYTWGTFGVELTQEQMLALAGFFESLAVFVSYKSVTPNIKVEAKVEKEVLHREATRSGYGSGNGR